MDEINPPSQAFPHQPRKSHDDGGQQLQVVQYRNTGQGLTAQWPPRYYPIKSSITNLLGIFLPELWNPRRSLPLPVYNDQPVFGNLLADKNKRKITHESRLKASVPLKQKPVVNNSQDIPRRRRRNVRGDQHQRRTEELAKRLGALGRQGESQSSIFLCWGKEDRCRIVAVHVSDAADDVSIWQNIQKFWYEENRDWRYRFGLVYVKEVRIVELKLAGPEAKPQAKHRAKFIGTYTIEQVATQKQRLEVIIADYDPQEYPCKCSPSTGHCSSCISCVTNVIDYIQCPEQTLYEAQRELSRLEMRPFLTFAFYNPNLAALNDLLDGERIVNSNLDILAALNQRHCPRLGELQFRALLIEEGWKPGSVPAVILFALVLLIFVILGAKLIFGDWGTTWNVGCFFVALATLVWMWANHAIMS